MAPVEQLLLGQTSSLPMRADLSAPIEAQIAKMHRKLAAVKPNFAMGSSMETVYGAVSQEDTVTCPTEVI